MICKNKYCWRCRKVIKKDKEMAIKGFSPFDMGEMGRCYVKFNFTKLGNIKVSGNSGGLGKYV